MGGEAPQRMGSGWELYISGEGYPKEWAVVWNYTYWDEGGVHPKEWAVELYIWGGSGWEHTRMTHVAEEPRLSPHLFVLSD